MFERDHIMRQVHQLAIALARAMHLRQSGQFEEAVEMLRTSLSAIADADFERLIRMSRRELLDFLGVVAGLKSEEMCGIGDVLYEYSRSGRIVERKDCAAARQRAIWIYEMCVASGVTVPLHVHERLADGESARSDGDVRDVQRQDVHNRKES